MSSDALFVLAGLPFGVQTAVGTENVARLPEAHPLAKVEVVAEDAAFSALLREADGVILFPNFAPLLAPVLGPDTRLRWVHSVAAGVNRVLIPELMAARQVVVTSSKGPMGPLMAEHCVLLMLALARDLPGYFQDQAERRWRHLADERPMIDLLGRTVAILGVGAVGGNLARMCKVGFGMRVLGLSRTRRDDPHVDRYYDRADLHAMLAEADFVVLTLAQTPETLGIIDAAALAAMKPIAYLVNVARGGLVDEPALIEALREGRIAGAGLDATATEPLPPESLLWTLPNVIITPHISPGRDRIGAEMTTFWCENIRRFAEGEPLLGIVDRDAGY